MKNIAMMLVSGIMGVLTLAIVMTIFGRVNRSVELQSNLSTAMELTLERRMGAEEGFLAGGADGQDGASVLAVVECVEHMAAVLDSDTGMTVKVYLADMEKGVLSMKVIADYKHPNGTDGSAEWERTVIYNKVETEEPEYHEVSFYRNKADMLGEGVCYKSMVIREGDCIHPPAEPAGAGADFAGWRDINDYMADFSCPVEQRLTYYADWE